jgi:hypothetical protein
MVISFTRTVVTTAIPPLQGTPGNGDICVGDVVMGHMTIVVNGQNSLPRILSDAYALRYRPLLLVPCFMFHDRRNPWSAVHILSMNRPDWTCGDSAECGWLSTMSSCSMVVLTPFYKHVV